MSNRKRRNRAWSDREWRDAARKLGVPDEDPLGESPRDPITILRTVRSIGSAAGRQECLNEVRRLMDRTEAELKAADAAKEAERRKVHRQNMRTILALFGVLALIGLAGYLLGCAPLPEPCRPLGRGLSDAINCPHLEREA